MNKLIKSILAFATLLPAYSRAMDPMEYAQSELKRVQAEQRELEANMRENAGLEMHVDVDMGQDGSLNMSGSWSCIDGDASGSFNLNSLESESARASEHACTVHQRCVDAEGNLSQEKKEIEHCYLYFQCSDCDLPSKVEISSCAEASSFPAYQECQSIEKLRKATQAKVQDGTLFVASEASCSSTCSCETEVVMVPSSKGFRLKRREGGNSQADIQKQLQDWQRKAGQEAVAEAKKKAAEADKAIKLQQDSLLKGGSQAGRSYQGGSSASSSRGSYTSTEVPGW